MLVRMMPVVIQCCKQLLPVCLLLHLQKLSLKQKLECFCKLEHISLTIPMTADPRDVPTCPQPLMQKALLSLHSQRVPIGRHSRRLQGC